MLRTDLKIYKSERMTQQADAGGQRTANEVMNGQLNEVFGNISDIDHAQSAVDIVKIYPAVNTNTTELLQDAHVLINEPPLDPKVEVMIIESTGINDGSERTDIVEAIESAVAASLLLRSGLSGMVAGQDTITRLDLNGNAAGNEESIVKLVIGQIICISVEYTGSESATWPRGQHFAKVIANGENGQGNVVFEPALPFATPDRITSINGQTRCTVVRATTVSSGVLAHGVTALTAESSGNNLAVTKTYGQLYPKITTLEARLNNLPLVTADNIKQKQIKVDADGLAYAFSVTDVAGFNPINLIYISAGIARTDGIRSFNGTQLSVQLNALPDPGTKVIVSYTSTVRYAQYDSTAGAIPAGWSLMLNTRITGSLRDTSVVDARRTFTTDPSTPGVLYVTRLNAVDRQQAAILGTDGAVAYYNDYAEIEYTAIIENDAAATEEVYSAEFIVPFIDIATDSFYIVVEASSGALLSASADSAGTITGTSITGSINNNFVSLTFAVPVKASTISYNLSEIVVLVPPSQLYGINSLRIPNDGRVSFFRPFGVIAVANNQFVPYASLNPAQTIAARPNSFIDIVDSEGLSLWHPLNENFTYNKTTGEVTIVGASGFTPPFELIDTLSELALVTGVTDTGLQISTPLQNTYAAGSIVSSVYQLGDLQARVTNQFDQVSWNSTWLDIIQGSPAPANFNAVAHPIELVNQSAINERWAIVFTSSTAFNCIGQNVGQVASYDTVNDFAPINPATNQPYFVIRALGWGGGWQPGNVMRFNTVAASKPAALLRSVAAGHSNIEQDSIRLHFRGNAQ